MAEFTTDGKHLYIDGKEVIKGWESFNGFFWFATEFVQLQDSVMDNGYVVVGDKIWFGYVQPALAGSGGLEDEWGDFSEAQLQELRGRVWPIPYKNLPFSGRRS